MTADQFREDALTVSGRATVRSTGNAVNGTSVVRSLGVIDGGKLDLRGNKLVVTGGAPGTWNGSAYTGVQGLVASGYNGGAWDGAGITTTLPQAFTGLTTLAVATADHIGVATFGGQSVTGSNVLVMYTYAGDTNFDGVVSGDDYGTIDFNNPRARRERLLQRRLQLRRRDQRGRSRRHRLHDHRAGCAVRRECVVRDALERRGPGRPRSCSCSRRWRAGWGGGGGGGGGAAAERGSPGVPVRPAIRAN